MACVKMKTLSSIKFTWNLKGIKIVKKKKIEKVGWLKLSGLNTAVLHYSKPVLIGIGHQRQQNHELFCLAFVF